MKSLISSENVLRKSAVFVPVGEILKFFMSCLYQDKDMHGPDSIVVDTEVFIINTCPCHCKLLDE